MVLSDFYKWLDNYLNFEKSQTKGIFWLESMRFLCGKLSNPQDKIPCIHVAGSKGKGSCSAMISSILEEAGYKCGVYESPHISDFRERIGTAHSFFEDTIYEKSADELTSLVDSIPVSELPGQRPLTWFELVTAFGFLCFKNAGCDFVVYETGLGGRLDSTNIVKPLASVLMPIELEHTEFLGDTVEKIASEKAGIIKNGIPAVIAPQNYTEADRVFSEKCAETGSKCIFVQEKIKKLLYRYNKNGTMRVEFTLAGINSGGSNSCVTAVETDFSSDLRLLGKVQAFNAATAAAAVKTALPEISEKTIEKGLSAAYLPGRFEVSENIVFDGAHTVKSISSTLETLDSVFPDKKAHLVFACAGDKDIKDIVPLFKGKFSSITFTEPKTVRHCNALKSAEIAEENGISVKIEKDVGRAIKNAEKAAENKDIVLIAGSFYLVAEAKKILSGPVN